MINENFIKILNDLIDKRIKEISPKVEIWLVSNVDEEKFTAQIQHPNYSKAVFDDVQIMSIGLGHFKGGIMKLPSIGDYVVVLFQTNSYKPIILGTVFNQTTIGTQQNPIIRIDELFLNNKEKGSYIVLKPDNTIIIRSVDSSGNKKASIELDTDGKIILNGGTQPVARKGDSVSGGGTISEGNEDILA